MTKVNCGANLCKYNENGEGVCGKEEITIYDLYLGNGEDFDCHDFQSIYDETF